MPMRGFHSAAFCAHLSSGSDAVLSVKRRFVLLCVSSQHGILAAFIFSTAVLLFKYSIQSSSSISPVSISSSVSFIFFLADNMHAVIVMENDTWETQEWMEPKFTSPVAVWPRHLSSPGHFVHVKSQEPGMREWSSVHDESERSLITSLIFRFFEYQVKNPQVVP